MKLQHINISKISMTFLNVGILILVFSLAFSSLSYAISNKEMQHKCGVGNANIKCWQNYANKNNSYAQFVLALFYAKGIVIDKDMKKSLMWYNKSANNGSYKAKYNLATIYYDGFSVKQDYKKALKLYIEVAEMKHVPRAELMIARIYKNGYGVAKDKIKAYAWYTLANIHDPDVQIEENHISQSLSKQQRSQSLQLIKQIKSKRKF